MPLPEGGQNVVWPPAELEEQLRELEEHDAFYSGDATRIGAIYGDPLALERKHVPLPGDLASTSADLLFSDPPLFEHSDDGLTEAIRELVDEIDLHDTLLEGAEVCAALSGVFLVPRWDKELQGRRPWLWAAHPDCAVPEFRGGELYSVIFWSELERSKTGRRVVRHLESHDVVEGKATITHAIYEGTLSELGRRVDDEALANNEKTKGLEPSIVLPIEGGLDCVYIPNLRPNRRHRDSPLGRSDFQGIEDLFIGLDRAFESWLRDVRLGKTMVIVPEEYIERKRGQKAKFNVDDEVFVTLPIDPNSRDKVGIVHVHPEIRTSAHSETMLTFIERAVTSLYSPQTFGLHIEGRAEAATALRIRERRTFLTQAKKRRRWGPALERLIENLLIIDKDILAGADVTVQRPTIKWAEITGEDISVLAGTIETLSRAGAISTEEKVKRVNPNWNEAQVKAELEAIRDEAGLAVPSPIESGAVG